MDTASGRRSLPRTANRHQPAEVDGESHRHATHGRRHFAGWEIPRLHRHQWFLRPARRQRRNLPCTSAEGFFPSSRMLAPRQCFTLLFRGLTIQTQAPLVFGQSLSLAERHVNSSTKALLQGSHRTGRKSRFWQAPGITNRSGSSAQTGPTPRTLSTVAGKVLVPWLGRLTRSDLPMSEPRARPVPNAGEANRNLRFVKRAPRSGLLGSWTRGRHRMDEYRAPHLFVERARAKPGRL